MSFYVDHFIEISDIKTDRDNRYSRDKKSLKSLFLLIGLSIILHSVIIVMLRMPAKHDARTPPKQAPISAVLVAPKRIVASPSPTSSEKTQIEDLSQSAVTPKAQAKLPVAQAEKAHTTLPEKEKPAAKDHGVPSARNEPAIDQGHNTARGLSRSQLQQALTSQMQQQQQQIAVQEAQQFRLNKVSPDLTQGYRVKEPELVPKPVTINCDKGVNSVLPGIAKLFGGQIQCNERNAFQGFIDKHKK